MTGNIGKRALPLTPHPNHLRKEAKARLAGLKERMPSVRLTDVQLILAREYGFANWSLLQAEVARRSAEGRRLRHNAAATHALRSAPADTDPDSEPEFFRTGLMVQIGFIVVALIGVAMVIAAGKMLPTTHGLATRLALLHTFL